MTQPAGRPWGRKAIALVCGGGCIYALWQYGYWKVSSSNPTPERPVIRKSPKTISALGRVVIEGEVVPVVASSAGTLRRLLVKEGDRVQAGQLIALLKGYEVWQQMLTSPTSQASNALRVTQLEAEYTKAIAQNTADRGDLAQQLLGARRALNQATPLSTARYSTQQLLQQLAAAEVRAPLSGQVLRIWVNSGDVEASQPIVEIGQIEKLYVLANFQAKFAGRLKVGQLASILTQRGQEELKGTIEEIRIASPVQVYIQLENPSRALALTDPVVKVKISAP